MTRVKKAVHALKNRRNTLRKVKGYRFGRSRKERAANDAIAHAGTHALRDRRKKKSVFRHLWTVRLSAALKAHDLSYSRFTHTLKESSIGLNRKMLSELAQDHPESFERLIQSVKK